MVGICLMALIDPCSDTARMEDQYIHSFLGILYVFNYNFFFEYDLSVIQLKFPCDIHCVHFICLSGLAKHSIAHYCIYYNL